MRAREFREGEECLTLVSRRPGVVLERRWDGVLVQFDGETRARRLHPEVMLEHE